MVMDRRSFIKAAGATAAATAVAANVALAGEAAAPAGVTADDKWAFEIPPAPIADDQIAETKSADIIVVGCGMSGMVTALSSAENGLSVIITTASEGAVSRGGSNNAVYSKVMEEMGLPKLDGAWYREQYMINTGNFKPALWFKYYKNSEEAMNWLIDHAAAAGIKTTIESGTEFPKGDIMYTPAGAHSFYVDDAELTSGGVGGGEPYIAAELARKLQEDMGVEIDFKCLANQLVKDGDRVVGVISQAEDGSYIKYMANKAVVLATGDFTHDRDMMYRYAPEVAHMCNFDSPVNYDAGLMVNGIMPGQGQKMELWAGAAWQKAPNVMMLGRPNLPADQPYTSHTGLMVDKFGQRFMNEDVLGGTACMTILQLPGDTAYMIWGANRAVEGGPWGIPNAVYGDKFESPEAFQATWDNDSYGFGVIKADTVEEIIEQLGLPAETIDTVNRYNEMCAAGEDTDFYKDPAKMIGITEAPFYGCAFTPMLLTVLGGTRSNVNLQVLDANDEPIPGLYHVGTMIGDFYCGTYTFAMEGVNYGATCVTLPYVLGKELAAL
ncbi:MAG: FAD-binding protein [Coriobacteriales bacterium]|nr:FAD-binding protein [Coriobacteriales bacterium]